MFIAMTIYILSVIICYVNTNHNKDLSVIVRGFVCLFPVTNTLAAIMLIAYDVEKIVYKRKYGID